MKRIVIQPESAVAGAVVLALSFLALGMKQDVSVGKVQVLTSNQQQVLDSMSIVYLDDGQGGTAKTIRLTGVNLQMSTFQVGTGNVIVGYNEPGNRAGDVRTGRGVLVVGQRNNYAGDRGRIVVGEENSATGGVALGGNLSLATGSHSSVTGGYLNRASQDEAWVGGGRLNEASGAAAAVIGGQVNRAFGDYSCINGGRQNTALARDSVVCGGLTRTASGLYDWVAGSLFEQN